MIAQMHRLKKLLISQETGVGSSALHCITAEAFNSRQKLSSKAEQNLKSYFHGFERCDFLIFLVLLVKQSSDYQHGNEANYLNKKFNVSHFLDFVKKTWKPIDFDLFLLFHCIVLPTNMAIYQRIFITLTILTLKVSIIVKHKCV